MTRNFKAIYENGVIRPLCPVEGLAERSFLDVTVETPNEAATGPHDFKALTGTLPAEDAAEILDIVEREFGQVDPGAW